MSNSKLATVKVPASTSNYSSYRDYKISKITVHHMAGVLTAKECGRVFQASGRGASAHYGIGSDGKIGQYVDEAYAAWADGNRTSNHKSVTIETANSSRGGSWPVSAKSLQLLIELCADIAMRNNLGKLVVGKNLTYHSMYCSTTCPGNYLRSKMQYIADEANKIITGVSKPTATTTTLYRVRKTWADAKSQIGAFASLTNAKNLAKKNSGYEVYDASGKVMYDPAATDTPASTTPAKKSTTEIAKEVIAGKWGNGDARKKKLAAAGYDYNTVQAKVNELLAPKVSKKSTTAIAKEVIAGKWGNGADRKKRLTSAGYDYNAVQKKVNELLK